MKRYIPIILLFLVSLTLYSCAEKFDITQFQTGDSGANLGGDTVYIPLQPAWEGFNGPQDIYIGKEPFIYIADTENNRLVMMNVAGQVLGSREVKRPVSIAQDFELNLIVAAEFDTVVNGSSATYSAVYKYNMTASGHDISAAPVTRLLPREAKDFSTTKKYTAVAAFYNNMIYVARTGPNNSSLFDPDNSILIFHPKDMYGKGVGDTLIGRVPNIDPISQGVVSANGISSMASFNRRNIDMIVTLNGNNSFKAQWFNYQISAIEEKYVSRYTPQDGVPFAEPDKFTRPEGSWVDNAGNIFIADAGADSIFVFNTFGDELQSFGGPSVFNEPYGVAVFDRVLYVADRLNNRILRFQLSTDQ